MNEFIDLNVTRDEAPVEDFADELSDEALDREGVDTFCVLCPTGEVRVADY